jgi:DNA-directed RNA polymerase subunit M/transcription elongation factor TFIIS
MTFSDKQRKAMYAKIQKPHQVRGINEPSREQIRMTKAFYGAKGATKHTGAYSCDVCHGNDAVFKKVISRGGGKISTNHCIRCNNRV